MPVSDFSILPFPHPIFTYESWHLLIMKKTDFFEYSEVFSSLVTHLLS